MIDLEQKLQEQQNIADYLLRENVQLRLELSTALNDVMAQKDASVLETVTGSLGWHRIAEYLMAAGDMRQTAGVPSAASWCFARAADCERHALQTIPLDRPKTRQIIAQSAEACETHASILHAIAQELST